MFRIISCPLPMLRDKVLILPKRLKNPGIETDMPRLSQINRSLGVSKTAWSATVSSTTPRPAPKCPPVTATALIVSVRSSSATWRSWLSGNFRRSSGVAKASRRGVAESAEAIIGTPSLACMGEITQKGTFGCKSDNQKQKAYPSITWSQNVALATQTSVKAGALYDHFACRMTN